MKKIIICLNLILSLLGYSQKKSDNQFIGELLYTKETKITDQKKLNKTITLFKNKFVNKLKENYVKEKQNEGIKIDSVGMIKVDELCNEIFEISLKYLLEETSLQLTQKHTKDSIKCYEIINHKKTNTINFVQNNSSILNAWNNKIIQDFYDDKISNLIIWKKETRTINGYDCFKITYDFETIIDSSENGFSFKGKKIHWVTENKSFKFFSFLKNKEINENYLPIEVIETIDDLDGFETRIKLESIKN